MTAIGGHTTSLPPRKFLVSGQLIEALNGGGHLPLMREVYRDSSDNRTTAWKAALG